MLIIFVDSRYAYDIVADFATNVYPIQFLVGYVKAQL